MVSISSERLHTCARHQCPDILRTCANVCETSMSRFALSAYVACRGTSMAVHGTQNLENVPTSISALNVCVRMQTSCIRMGSGNFSDVRELCKIQIGSKRVHCVQSCLCCQQGHTKRWTLPTLRMASGSTTRLPTGVFVH